MREHTIEQGECLMSLAHQTGLFWETIWNHPSNAQLKASRKGPNLVLPGDIVTIPDKSPQGISAATDARHRFVRRGVPSQLRLRFANAGDDSPRKGVPFVVSVDGHFARGTTDEDGCVVCAVSPSARQGDITLNPGAVNEEVFEIQLRHMDPEDSVTGLQARLQNLSFYGGPIDGEPSDALREAIRSFQTFHKLTESGEADAATRAAVVKAHGC